MNPAAAPDLTIEAFESGRNDPAHFDHEAHVYLAWLYLERLPVLEAARRYSDALRRLTQRLGIPGKYHETITCFYLFVIAERREASGRCWPEFRRRNQDLLARGESSVLNRFYTRETLASERARKVFVLPDRRAAA